MILKINDKEIKNIVTNKISVGEYRKNNEEFYALFFSTEFMIGDEKGYISIDFGLEEENDINLFLNKTYTPDDNENSCIEIYDCNEFIDLTFDDHNMTIITKDIKDNKLNFNLSIKHEFIKVDIDGYIDIENKN